tara:strand:- start:8 stop:568 length:561 start_codon:yes stop_codon:yes gene_type:complete
MNKGLRLKFTPEAYAILSDYRDRMVAELRETNWSKAINEIVIEYDHLVRHFHATPAPLSRHSSYVRETVDLNIKEKNIYTKKETSTPRTKAPLKKRGKHLLPKDFAPPRSIAKEAGVDYEGAVECFADWANSQGKKYTDWTACFRNACRSWLKEKFPHLRRTPIKAQGNTEILRNEDMSDTRPPLV